MKGQGAAVRTDGPKRGGRQNRTHERGIPGRSRGETQPTEQRTYPETTCGHRYGSLADHGDQAVRSGKYFMASGHPK